MADLDERFRSLARTRAPDLWPEAECRLVGPIPAEPRPGGRWLAAAVAFAVAAAGLAVVAVAFRDGDRQSPTATSPNGVIAYVADGELWVVAPDGSNARPLVSDLPGEALDPSWSPDGGRLVFAVRSLEDARSGPEAGETDLYLVTLDGSDLNRLTTDGVSSQPSWSPDGSEIAYTHTSSEGTTQIWIMEADGSNARPFTGCGGPECSGDSFPAWSPDGERIAFVRITAAGAVVPVSVNIWPVDGSTNQPNSSIWEAASVAELAWSPDGSEIAFASDLDGPNLYVMDADTGDVRQLTREMVDPSGPAWSPDGSQIVLSALRPGTHDATLYVMDRDGSHLHEIAGLPNDAMSPSWGQSPALPEPVEASPSPTQTPPPAVTPTVSGPIPVETSPGAVSAVAYGFDSAWIASIDGSGQGWLTRLDLQTGEALARISTGDVHPTWEVGGGGLAAGEGSMWLAGAARAPGEPSGVRAFLLRIDPAMNQVIATIDLQASAPADVASDDSGVWVMSFGLGERPTMEVSRVDPMTDEMVATVPLVSWYVHHLFNVGGWIVASTNAGAPGEHAATPDGVLNVIDPQTETEIRTVPVGPSAWPAAGDGALWLATGDALERIDPSSGDVLARHQVPNTGDALGVGEGGVWFIDPEGRIVLRRFNPSSGIIDVSVELPEGTTPIAMATSPGAVWVLNYEGTVTRVGLT